MVYTGYRKTMPIGTRFWSWVNKEGPIHPVYGQCWLWMGKPNAAGYGRFCLPGERIMAHRYSYKLNVGDVKDDEFVLHRCDTRLCVNPEHLFLGSHQDNTADMVAKERQCKGVDSPHAKLSDDLVRYIRRYCGEVPLGSTERFTRIRKMSSNFGVTIGSIYEILNWKTWRHVKDYPNEGERQMAMQQTKATSKLGQRYGPALDQAVLAHKDAPIDTGFSRLPGGILAGIARLMECGFQEHKADSKAKKADGTLAHTTGEMFFQAVGVVQEPKSVETPQGTVVTRGGQTRVFVPMYDTKTNAGKVTTQGEQVFEVLNHFKLLAGGENGGQAFVDQFLAAYPNPGDALEAMAAALLAAKPHFKFKTESGAIQTTGPYAGKPPMVFENWLGAVDYTPPAAGGVRDASGPPTTATHVNGQQAAASPPAPTEGTNRITTAIQTAEPQKTDAAVAEMLAAANGDVTDPKTVAAQNQIRAWALAAGVPEGDTGIPNTVDGSESWEEVVKLMLAAEASPPAAAEEAAVVEEPAAGWQKGQVCQITVGTTDPKTKAKSTRKVHCEVQNVHPDGLCDLLNMDDRKTVYGKVKQELMQQVVVG